MSKIKVKIINPQENAKNYSREKELVSAYSLVAKKGRELSEAITVRVYMGKSRSTSTVYASIWVRPGKDGKEWISGTGQAGGWGYCKESQAIADAITSAGIELYGDPYGSKETNERMRFGGTGLSRIEGILTAIAKAQGFNVNGALLIKH